MDLVQIVRKTFNFKIGNLSLAPEYWQAVVIVFLLFLLVLTLARLRYLFIKWSFSGWQAWLLMGFLLALILEGFFLIGGRTILTSVLGWKNPPKPISATLNAGRAKLIDVLGISDEIPTSSASEEVTAQDVVKLYQTLNPDASFEARSAICKP